MTRKPSSRQTVGVGPRADRIARKQGTGIWRLATAVLAIAVSLPVQAAGPKAGQIYAGFGGGLFTPEFNLEDSSQASIGPTVQRQNIAIPRISIGPIGFRLPVDSSPIISVWKVDSD